MYDVNQSYDAVGAVARNFTTLTNFRFLFTLYTSPIYSDRGINSTIMYLGK